MEKIFTVEEANRTLPLVGRIVEDLVRDHARWEDKVREFELATVGASPDHPDAIADLLQIEAQRLARDIEGYIAELNELGDAHRLLGRLLCGAFFLFGAGARRGRGLHAARAAEAARTHLRGRRLGERHRGDAGEVRRQEAAATADQAGDPA